jgi:hypothetical protein
MNLSNHSRSRRFSLARHVVVVSVVAFAAFLVGIGPAAASTTEWDGKGTDESGACSSVTGSGTEQTWHFVLTSPDPGPWELTATFTNSGTKTDTGEQQGGGAVFFFVTTSAGDTLESASATNGGNNLTVSGCVLSGGPPETAPPETAPPETAPPSPPAPTAAPSVPAPVRAAARFTG